MPKIGMNFQREDTMKPMLSICVVTMNRAKQLREALESCLACVLPKDTEFVIVDNASADDTEQVVKELLSNSGYPFYYEKLNENIGCGGGRNYAFTKAKGEFIYVLDDDAIIDNACPNFFTDALLIMNKHYEIITLTTQIYDTAWGRNRLPESGVNYREDLYKIKMFCGGSHFIRKSFFITPPYLSNRYGYEELPPSLRVCDAGKINAYCPNLKIIHNPKINKWDRNDVKNHELLIKECAILYAIKKMMYPRLFIPLLWIAYKIRCKKHLSNITDGSKKSKKVVNYTIKQYYIDYRIKIKTVLGLWRDFSFSIF